MWNFTNAIMELAQRGRVRPNQMAGWENDFFQQVHIKIKSIVVLEAGLDRALYRDIFFDVD